MKLRGSLVSGGVLILIGALLVAGAFFGVLWIGRAANREVPVVVATHEVLPLQPVMNGDVQIQMRPAAAIGKAGAYTDVRRVVGQYARFGMVPGEIVRPAMLAASAAAASNLDVALTDAGGKSGGGLRAVPLAVDAAHGFGLPVAGDRVDLLATLRQAGGPQAAATGGGQTGVIVAGAPVLEVFVPGSPQGNAPAGPLGGGAPQPQQAQQGVVVLALSALDAERVALAQVAGAVTMILDPLGGAQQGPVAPVTVTGLFEGANGGGK